MSVLEQNFYILPFEQFMGCLYSANSDIANRVVRSAFGRQEPNDNHKVLATVASIALQKKLCRQFTIFTTNYDLGIENAFRAIGNPLRQLPKEEWLAEGAPTYTIEDADSSFQLIKLHGSVDQQLTLAFTYTEITKKFTRQSHFEAVREIISSTDLLLFIGYGLNDFDLRPIIQSGLKGSTCITVWNDRPENPSKATTPETGQNQAPKLLIEESGINTYKSDLYSSDESVPSPNILTIVAGALGLTPVSIPPYKALLNAIDLDVQDCVNELDLEECVSFLAGVADSCSSADAETLVRPYATGDLPSDRRSKHVSVYMSSLTHKAEYSTALDFVERFIKSERVDKATKVTALGQGGLICTLRGEPLSALTFFLKGYVIRFTSWKLLNSEAPLEFSDYWWHFWLRCTGYVGHWSRSARFPLSTLGVSVELLMGLVLSLAYGRLVYKAETKGDLRLLGNCTISLAESFRFGRMLDRAKFRAEGAVRIHSQIQQPNAIIMSERTRAWIYSADGSMEGIEKARQGLARTVRLASRSVDETLLTKCAKELLRVVLFECQKLITDLLAEINFVWSKGSSTNTKDVIIGAEHLLQKPDWGKDTTIRSLESLTTLLASQCKEEPEWLQLCEELERFADVHRYPRLYS